MQKDCKVYFLSAVMRTVIQRVEDKSACLKKFLLRSLLAITIIIIIMMSMINIDNVDDDNNYDFDDDNQIDPKLVDITWTIASM